MTGIATYSVRDGRLQIAAQDSTVIFDGYPDGMAVRDLIALDSDAIVLLEPAPGYTSVRNLVRMNPQGDVMWRAELPNGSSNDCFVSFGLDSAADVVASTWNGWRVRVSSSTGEIVAQEFAK